MRELIPGCGNAETVRIDGGDCFDRDGERPTPPKATDGDDRRSDMAPLSDEQPVEVADLVVADLNPRPSSERPFAPRHLIGPDGRVLGTAGSEGPAGGGKTARRVGGVRQIRRVTSKVDDLEVLEFIEPGEAVVVAVDANIPARLWSYQLDGYKASAMVVMARLDRDMRHDASVRIHDNCAEGAGLAVRVDGGGADEQVSEMIDFRCTRPGGEPFVSIAAIVCPGGKPGMSTSRGPSKNALSVDALSVSATLTASCTAWDALQ